MGHYEWTLFKSTCVHLETVWVEMGGRVRRSIWVDMFILMCVNVEVVWSDAGNRGCGFHPYGWMWRLFG